MLLRCYKHTIFAYISGKNAVTAFFLLLLQKIRVFAYISVKNAVTAFFLLLLHLLLKLPKQKEKMTIYSYFSPVTAKKCCNSIYKCCYSMYVNKDCYYSNIYRVI